MGRITGTGTAGSPAPVLSMGAIIHRPRVVASIVCVHSQPEQVEPLRHLPASTPKHLHRREVVSKCALVRDFETLQALHRCTNYEETPKNTPCTVSKVNVYWYYQLTKGERHTMTIKELADRCGTHKTGIRRTIDRLGLSDQLTKDENGVVQIPEHIAEQVAAQYQTTPETPEEQPQDTPENSEDTHHTTAEQALLTALEALREQLAVKDKQIETQQQTIATLTAALSNAQTLHAGTMQQLLAAPATVSPARTEETPEKPENEEQAQRESVPVEHEAPQTPSDRTDKPEASGEKKGGETITPQSKPVERHAEAPQSKAEPKRGERNTRKGFFGLFNRK